MIPLSRPAGSEASADATGLLRAWRAGDSEALEALTPLVYDSLRARAGNHLRKEGPGHSLAATELVHEVFLRLMVADVSWQDRAHFLAVASRSMRRLLVNHGRDKKRVKRGSGARKESLDKVTLAGGLGAPSVDVLALNAALEELAQRDADKARVVELAYFGGLTVREIAEVVQGSKSAVQRDLDFAKAWLLTRLGDP